ncbi:hypothetical protein CHUAL_013931 [Chamberlinius hualienensis]
MDGNVPELIANLENAAFVCLGPPDVVSAERRRAAEEIFITFKKLKNPLSLCKHILEVSKVDYVLFQTVVLLRESVTREWRSLDRSSVEQMLNYLLSYVLEKSCLQPYVQQQILLVIAIIVKRGNIEGWETRMELLNKVSQLISSGNSRMQMIGCSILSHLLQEYANTVGSIDISLSWESHYRAKKDFEAVHLKNVFQFCVQLLSEVENMDISPELLTILKGFLGIAEQILAEQAPFLRPGPTWRSILLDENLIKLFYKIHWKVRSSAEVAHCSLNCLIQLASLNGTIFSNMQDRVKYLTTYLYGFMNYFVSNELHEHEILGTIGIINKLIMVFPPTILLELPSQAVKEFLSKITTFTCHVACVAAKEEATSEDDPIYAEGFDRLLGTWLSIINDGQIMLDDESGLSAIKLFDTYLMCHLSPPQGTRPITENENYEEMQDINEDDRTKHKDQLIIMGKISRRALPHTLPLLIKLLEEKTAQLTKYYERCSELSSSSATFGSDSSLMNLYEDIHWLILLSGNTLFAYNDGEVLPVPDKIMQYSIEQAQNVDIGMSLQLLTTHRLQPDDVNRCDRVLRLVAGIFHLCYLEKTALGCKLFSLLSPELASTLVWFFENWSLTYLLFNEAYYDQISGALSSAFGRGTDMGQWILRFLLDLITSNLATWDSETSVVDGTVSLLLAISDSREKCVSILKLDGAINTIISDVLPVLKRLSKSAKKNMMKALILIASAEHNFANSDSLFYKLLQPLRDQWSHITSTEWSANRCNDHSTKVQVVHILESVTGVMKASDATNAVSLFSYTYPVLRDCASILEVYRNYQDVIETVLELHVEAAKRLLCFLPQTESCCLYSSCISAMKVFAATTNGRQSRECTAEEEQLYDVSLLMELLTNLLSKVYLNFSSSEDDDGVVAADVAISGLDIVMPLLNVDLLHFPKLCSQYFKLVTLICELHPERVCHLPENLLRNLIASIQLAFTRFGSEIVILCLDFLGVLATYIFRNHQSQTLASELIKPFIKTIIEYVFLDTAHDVITTAGSTLYPLIACYQSFYNDVMSHLLTTQIDNNHQQLFVEASNRLMDSITFSDDRLERYQFRQQFETFVLEVRSLVSA